MWQAPFLFYCQVIFRVGLHSILFDKLGLFSLFGCSEENVSDALAMLLARCCPEALNAFITEYEYDGADTEDPEPESEFNQFCEAVYNCIRAES